MAAVEGEKGKNSRWTRWAYIFAGVAVALAGGIKLLGAVTLPGCGDHQIVQTVRELVKQSTQITVSVSDEKLISETDSERLCSAHIQGTDGSQEEADITYRVFWDGWSKMVNILESKPT